MSNRSHEQFEQLCLRFLREELKYDVRVADSGDRTVDIVGKNDEKANVAIETKLYRSRRVPYSWFTNALERLISSAKELGDFEPILMISSELTTLQRTVSFEKNVTVYGINEILERIRRNPDLVGEFENLLTKAI